LGSKRFELVEIHYPGFEGQARAPSFDAFLASVDGQLGESGAEVGYASGIAALFALALRARRLARGVRWIFQGPVLWGLEHRFMPRLLRVLPAEPILRAAFGSPSYQRRFVKKQFLSTLDDAERDAFFAGYASCSAFADFFAWLGPPLLRDLERSFAEDRAALAGIEIWLGERDRVVDVDEVTRTERALGVSFPVRRFPSWGHYPMIDDAAGWVREVGDAVA
jgi:hypothetical protein